MNSIAENCPYSGCKEVKVVRTCPKSGFKNSLYNGATQILIDEFPFCLNESFSDFAGYTLRKQVLIINAGYSLVPIFYTTN